ncbi:MFS transporter [Nocardiopsis sp. Huas11]|uniref:MFS transporter n=1 Tax=Nocardiopsis sp. Huas11 TaxID=2183912 RepID=UPI000F26D82A|nr:MFS transporter [Nocardiopsis sp. Huas11]RKS07421.1 MFS transporter [Nocardiopsis sp. Huas11]
MSRAAPDRRPSRRPLVGLVLAQACSYTGTRLAMVALPWFVLTTTGSATDMGLVTLCELGAYTLARLLSGPLLDRLGHRVVSVRLDVVAAVALLCVPLLHARGLLAFPLLLVLVTVVGLATGPSETAKVSLTPFVAAATRMRVERVAGLTGTVDRFSQTVGPIAAGAVVATAGALHALYANAVLMVLASVVLTSLVPRSLGRTDAPPAAGGGADPPPRAGYLAQLYEGWRTVWGDACLRALVLMIMVTNLVDVAVMTVVLPVWVAGHGAGAQTVGLIAGVLGGASVLGAVTAAWIGHRLPRRATFFTAFLVSGPPRILVLALDVPLWAVLVVWGASGLAGGLINPILSAVLFERLPADMTGRGMAVVGALARIGAPVGAPLVGLAVGLVGTSPVLLVCAAVYLLATTLPVLGPAAAAMAAPPAHAPVRTPGSPSPPA